MLKAKKIHAKALKMARKALPHAKTPQQKALRERTRKEMYRMI